MRNWVAQNWVTPNCNRRRGRCLKNGVKLAEEGERSVLQNSPREGGAILVSSSEVEGAKNLATRKLER